MSPNPLPQSPAFIVTDASLWGDESEGRSAVAVGIDGRISAVGPAEEVVATAGSATDVISLAGASLWPAFHDSHVHPLAGGLELTWCNLNDVHDLAKYEGIVRAYADGLPAGRWLRGGGWFSDVFPGKQPHRRLLDQWAPNHPAILTSHDNHCAWVNSAALRLAGINAATEDPFGARIGRDPDGTPDGLLFEGAIDLVSHLLPDPAPAELDAAYLLAQQHLHSFGIAGWQDALVGRALHLPDPTGTYRRLQASGALTSRVTGALWWDREKGLKQIEEFKALRDGAWGDDAEGDTAWDDKVRFDTVKIMQDGICESCTGAMLEPYAGVDGRPGEPSGPSMIDPVELKEIVTALDAAGFSAHFHGVGDRAVRECLDAVEAARHGNGPSGLRHQIAHVDVVDPADVPRFAALGVTANLQPLWARADKEIIERKLPLLGLKRAAMHFPFGALQGAGAALAMGSDWPVSSMNPLWGIYTAVTRTAPPSDPHGVLPSSYSDPMNPEQRLTLSQALEAYTSGSARANGYGDRTGTIAVGMEADLIALDRRVTEVGDLPGARVARTWVAGRTVHAASAAKAAAGS
ncbi:amidohydrolase [Arthrobacter ginkgonis]|uniref:Amidohydrolase n=1 Tax=Arthrobacter ginkgonis TaxID=1630594 RepID=A0ABP7C6B6_9MICC